MPNNTKKKIIYRPDKIGTQKLNTNNYYKLKTLKNNNQYSKTPSKNNILTLLVIEDTDNNGNKILRIADVNGKKHIQAPKYIDYIFNPKNLKVKTGKIDMNQIKKHFENSDKIYIDPSAEFDFYYLKNDKGEPVISNTQGFKGLDTGTYLIQFLKNINNNSNNNYTRQKNTTIEKKAKEFFSSIYNNITNNVTNSFSNNNFQKTNTRDSDTLDNIETIYLSKI